MNFKQETLIQLEELGIVAGFSIERVEDAVPLAKALLSGGIKAIELTLRTPAALDAVKEICTHVPEMLVGVGTILAPETIKDIKAAGADFGVSPGINSRVVQAAKDEEFSFAPGICSPSDLETAIELGCRFVKYFPAETSGGIRNLRSMSAPYSHLDIQYFPLGGLNATNMIEYLREENIPVIGGSWIVAADLVTNKDWDGITQRAAEVCSMLNINRKG